MSNLQFSPTDKCMGVNFLSNISAKKLNVTRTSVGENYIIKSLKFRQARCTKWPTVLRDDRL